MENFKPEIINLQAKILGPAICSCNLISLTDNKNYWENLCPGCQIREHMAYCIMAYITNRTTKEVLYKVLEGMSSANIMSIAELLDEVENLKTKFNELKLSVEELKRVDGASFMWNKLFGEEDDSANKSD